MEFLLNGVLPIVIIIVTLVAIGFGVGASFEEYHRTKPLHQQIVDFKQQAIDHGYAHYHPQTGEWQWVEPAEQEADIAKD